MPNAREVTQKKQHWTGFTIPSILGVGGAPMHVNQRLKIFQPKSAAGEKLWEKEHPLVKGRRRRVKTKVWKTIGVPACIFDPALILSFHRHLLISTSTYHHHEAKQWEFHFRPHPQLSFSSTLFFSCGSSLNFQQTTFQSEISVLASELQTKNYLQVIIILSFKCQQNSDPRQAFLTLVFLSDDFNCVRHCLCLLLPRSLGLVSAQHFNFRFLANVSNFKMHPYWPQLGPNRKKLYHLMLFCRS